MRRAIEHPHIDLVGVYVHSAAKVGRDAGDLAGVGRTGIAATNSLDAVIALRPDCVMYMPQYTNLDEVCRLLSLPQGGNGGSKTTRRKSPLASRSTYSLSCPLWSDSSETLPPQARFSTNKPAVSGEGAYPPAPNAAVNVPYRMRPIEMPWL